MNLRIKRSFLVYVGYLLAICLDGHQLFFSVVASERGFAAQSALAIGLIVLVAFLMWMLIKRDYISVDGQTLTIVHDYFICESFLLTEISGIELSSSPFESSNFVLKNGFKIRFSYFYLTEKGFKKLKEFLNVPIT